MAYSYSSSFFSMAINLLLFIATIISLLASHSSAAVTLPFHPRDVLPLLPDSASRPIINSLNSPVDLLPKFVGAASTGPNKIINWVGSCFRKNTAWLEVKDDGGILHIKVSDAKTWTCIDLYVFATPFRVNWDYYFRSKEHTHAFKLWEGKDEYEYVKSRGISVFLMPAGMLGTLKAFLQVIPLFLNNEAGEKANLNFLEKNMKATFEERPKAAWVTNINPNYIHSGDFLVISKIRGRYGAFETLEKWVTGAYAGHTAVCLRDTKGKLWVAESGRENEKGEDVIGVVPWEEWWEFEREKDNANPHISLLRLNEEKRKIFNKDAAWEFVEKMNGKPYGYHNMIFSWIDTPAGNYPSPLDANMVAAAMTVWNAVKPESATNLWNRALNLRLGTNNLDFPEILVEVEKRGSSFEKLLAIPEEDNWNYENGKSVSCVAFVVEMYKEAGLFGPLTSTIQATEFTVKDGYTLKFFENNQSQLPEWCNEGDTVKLPYCQILGKYRMPLPGYNSIEPYQNMNQNCPSLPPDYSKPNDC